MSYSEIIINGIPIKLIPLGDCACGCGQKTKLASKNDKSFGLVKDQPRRFICGHNRRGKLQGRQDGEKYINTGGYVQIKMRTHHRAASRGYVYEHILVLEKHLGRPLIKGESPHHRDENRSNNSPYNLILFATQGMHLSYHARLRAYKACGHWDYRKCWVCSNYDSLVNLQKFGNSTLAHPDCRRNYEKSRLDKKKNGTTSHP